MPDGAVESVRGLIPGSENYVSRPIGGASLVGLSVDLRARKMHLRGHDSNHDRPLGAVLRWVAEAPSVPPRRPQAAVFESKRLANGVVKRAVLGALGPVGTLCGGAHHRHDLLDCW